MKGGRVAPALWVGVISDLECKKSGCRWVAGRVSGENRGKSRARQTGSMVMFGTTTVLGDQNHVMQDIIEASLFHIKLCIALNNTSVTFYMNL